MSKFNMDALKKGRKENATSIYGEREDTAGEQTIRVGGGLLDVMNKRSAQMAEEYVDYNDIRTSVKNEWSMEEESIKELAELIKDVGLLNPPIVKKEGNTYTIVAGERRYRAIGYLIQKREWEIDKPVKVHIFSPDIIDLPLTDDQKEDYVRLAENAGQRGKTDGDLFLQMKGYQKIYTELRKKGELSGIKTRQLLENDMKISGSKIAQFQKIENRGSDALKEALLDDKVTASTGVKVADMPLEEQEKFIKQVREEKKDGEKIERVDILKYEERKNTVEDSDGEKKGTDVTVGGYGQEEEKEQERKITVERLRKDINPIIRGLKREQPLLTEKQYENYLRLINQLRSLLN